MYLHNFRRSDDDRALHDHPWANCSILLSGAYVEFTPSGRFVRYPFRPVFRRAGALHRGELIHDIDAWSLFVTGPKIREWGFACPQDWRHWREYVAPTEHGNEIGRGCE